jgi:hypothetical protein
MTSNLKLILSAAGVAALLASPAMAKSHARTATAVPADAHASAAPFTGRPVVTPYAPDLPQRAHEAAGPNPDFQLSSEK